MGLREPRAVHLLRVDTTSLAASLQMGRAGLQGHPVMDCTHFGSLPSRAAGMAWELLSIMSGTVCYPGSGSFWCLRMKSLMLIMALGQGDFSMSVLPLLLDLVPSARLNWCLLPTEKVKRSPGCPVCLI